MTTVTVDTPRWVMMKPIPLVTGREAARVLRVTHARFNRAVRTGKIKTDCISNGGDFFFLETIRRLSTKPQLFPR